MDDRDTPPQPDDGRKHQLLAGIVIRGKAQPEASRVGLVWRRPVRNPIDQSVKSIQLCRFQFRARVASGNRTSGTARAIQQ